MLRLLCYGHLTRIACVDCVQLEIAVRASLRPTPNNRYTYCVGSPCALQARSFPRPVLFCACQPSDINAKMTFAKGSLNQKRRIEPKFNFWAQPKSTTMERFIYPCLAKAHNSTLPRGKVVLLESIANGTQGTSHKCHFLPHIACYLCALKQNPKRTHAPSWINGIFREFASMTSERQKRCHLGQPANVEKVHQHVAFASKEHVWKNMRNKGDVDAPVPYLHQSSIWSDDGADLALCQHLVYSGQFELVATFMGPCQCMPPKTWRRKSTM